MGSKEVKKPKFKFGEELFDLIKRGGIVGLIALVVGFILLLNLITPFLAGWFPSLNNLPSAGGAMQILFLFVAGYMFLALARLLMQLSARGHQTQFVSEYLDSAKSMVYTTLIVVAITLFLTYAIAEGWIGIDFSILPQQFSLISP